MQNLVYFPTPPQIGKPEMLLQIAVRLTYVVLMEIEVTVLAPKANKNRLESPPSGSENPG
jgi:hypothetical protein